MLIQVRGVVVHAMSGTELSHVRTEFRLRLPEPINKSPLESRGPTLLCNQVKSCVKCPVTRAGSKGRCNTCAQFTRWSLEAQSFSRALIETQRDLVQLGLRVAGKVGSLRQVFP
jgi:hypothetical protein